MKWGIVFGKFRLDFPKKVCYTITKKGDFDMKKQMAVFLSTVLGMSIPLVACSSGGGDDEGTPSPAPYNTEFVFAGVTFEKSASLTLEDLKSFLPHPQRQPQYAGVVIETVEDFEEFLRENLDTYYIEYREGSLLYRMPFDAVIDSINVKTEQTLEMTYYPTTTATQVEKVETPYYLKQKETIWEYHLGVEGGEEDGEEGMVFYWDGTSTFSWKRSIPLETPNYFNVVYNYCAE